MGDRVGEKVLRTVLLRCCVAVYSGTVLCDVVVAVDDMELAVSTSLSLLRLGKSRESDLSHGRSHRSGQEAFTR